jgi:hypothetical protein
VLAVAVSTATRVTFEAAVKEAVVEAAGNVARATVEVAVSPEATPKNPAVVRVVEAFSPKATVVVAAESVKVGLRTAALEGATDITPKPNAATVTSAMRLKVVFVDICFLSIVDSRTIPDSAWIVFRPSSR